MASKEAGDSKSKFIRYSKWIGVPLAGALAIAGVHELNTKGRMEAQLQKQGLAETIPDHLLKQVKRAARRSPSSVETSFRGSRVNLGNQFGELARYRTAQKSREVSGTTARTETARQTVEASLGIPFLGLINPDSKKRKFGPKQAIPLLSLMALMASCTAPMLSPTAARPTELAPKPTMTETAVPRLTIESLVNGPLAKWSTYLTQDTQGSHVWLNESNAFYKDTNGQLAIFHPQGDPDTSVAFGQRKYLITQGQAAPGVVAASENTLVMMYTQKSGQAPEAKMLVGNVPTAGSATVADAYVRSDDPNSGLTKDATTQLKIALNSDGTYLFSLIESGKEMPLVLETAADQMQPTPASMQGDVFDVSYIKQDPSAITFASEVSTGTQQSPAETSTPVSTPTEAAPKNGDIKTVTENGHEYRYTYNAELGWVREIAVFNLFDWPTFNSVPYRIVVTETVPGERNLITMTHKDFTMADIPSSGRFDPPPITATFMGQLQKLTGKKGPDFLSMLDGGAGHERLSLPITLSDGKDANVTLGPNSGIRLTIMTPEKLKELGGDHVSTGYVDGTAFYAEVYGVDSQGNELVRLAFDVSLDKVPDEALRQALFMIPGRLAEKKDQQNMGPSSFSIALAHTSRWTVVDGKTQQTGGTSQDLEIQYLPSQP